MHRRPQRPVGKTRIVFLTIKRGEVEEHIMDVSFVDYSGLRTRLGNNPAAPSEPQPLIGLKGLSQCNGQAAGCSFVGRIGNRYTVRNNDEARQRTSNMVRREE